MKRKLITCLLLGLLLPFTVSLSDDVEGEVSQNALPSQLTLEKLVAVPVDLVKGRVRYTPALSDVRFKSRKMFLEVARNYQSDRTNETMFGLGWDWNHGEKIVFPTAEDMGTDNANVLRIKTSSGEYTVYKGLKRYPPIQKYPRYPNDGWYKIFGVLANNSGGLWNDPSRAARWWWDARKYSNNYSWSEFTQKGSVRWWGWNLPNWDDDNTKKIVKLKATWMGHTYADDKKFYRAKAAAEMAGRAYKVWGTSSPEDDFFSLEYIPPDGITWAEAANEKLYINNIQEYKPLDLYTTWVFLVMMSVYYIDDSDDWMVPEGASYTFSQAGSEMDRTYTITFKDKSRQVFDDSGRLLKKTDSRGNTLHFYYDSNENLERMEDDIGQTIFFAYTNTIKGGRVSRLGNDEIGYCKYGYDENGLLTSYTDLEGNISHYAYSPMTDLAEEYPEQVLARVEMPHESVSHFIYYGKEGNAEYLWGKVLSYTNPVGTGYVFKYDNENRLAFCEINGEQTVGVTYNDRDDVSQRFVRDKIYVDTESLLLDLHGYDEDTFFVYRNNSHNVNETIQGNRKHIFTYDNNNMTSKTDPLSNTWHFAYDEIFNTLITQTNPLGVATTVNSYDDKGSLTNTCDALGHCISMTYDEYGNLTSQKDALGNTTRYEYDPQGIGVKNS